MGVEKEVVVGRDVAQFLESGAELLKRMVYPMKSGVVGRDDARAWKVLKELTWMVLEEFKPRGFGFNGFYVVAALAACRQHKPRHEPKYISADMVWAGWFRCLRRNTRGGMFSGLTMGRATSSTGP
jgi:hypothetical protein